MQDLIDKIPHKEPALLLESVVELTTNRVVCGVLRNPHASLAPDGLLPAAIGLEVLGQTAAVWMMANARQPATAGVLIQTRELQLNQPFLDTPLGLTSEVVANEGEGAGWLGSFEGRILDPEQRILVSGKFVILSSVG